MLYLITCHGRIMPSLAELLLAVGIHYFCFYLPVNELNLTDVFNHPLQNIARLVFP